MRRFRGRYRIDSARLPGHDYGAPGWYFVTLCTRDRAPVFGRVRGGVMGLSPAGCIAARQWQRTPQVRPSVHLDAWIVMPNHMHGLIGLTADGGGGPRNENGGNENGGNENVETLRRNVSTTTTTAAAGTAAAGTDAADRHRPPSKNERMAAISPDAGSLPVIVRAYKSIVTRRIRRTVHPGFAWQARYYDRVVRDDAERRRIRRYIQANPRRWTRDRHHPDRRG